MVSQRYKQQAAIHLKVMRLISVNPEISTRQFADLRAEIQVLEYEVGLTSEAVLAPAVRNKYV